MKLTPIQKKIRDYVTTHRLSSGLGTEDSACTIAAINLAISGRLVDSRPDCVCPVIHKWVIPIQDAMPDNLRNNGWTELVPFIAGSFNPELEAKRKAIILDWLWTIVLPQLLPIAIKYGFGKEWSVMLELKIYAAAYAAAAGAAAYAAADAAYAAAYAAYTAAAAGAADAAAAHAAYAAADAAYAARGAADAADAARAAAAAAASAADAYAASAADAYAASADDADAASARAAAAADAGAYDAADAARAAAAAAAAAAHAAYAAADADAGAYDAADAADAYDAYDAYWKAVDPAKLLNRLLNVKP